MKHTKGRGLSKDAWKVMAIFAVVVMGIGAVFFGMGGKFQVGSIASTGTGKVVQGTGDNADPTTLSVIVNDALSTSTKVTTTNGYLVNGKYSASAISFAPGDVVQVISNASNYISGVSVPATLTYGNNKIFFDMYAYSAPTVRILQDNTALSNSLVGAVNGSKTSSGGRRNLIVEVTGNDLKSTGEAVFVVDLSDSANVSDVYMFSEDGKTALTPASVPRKYTKQKGFQTAFVIPAITGNSVVKYQLNIVAVSSTVVQGAVYTKAYVKNNFVDTDGSFKFGVEDSKFTDKSLSTWTYNIQLK